MSSYTEEQDKLKQEAGLEEDAHYEDTSSEFPEVSPEVYKDVDPLLFRGFLHMPATINDVPFVFKSLNHHEFELLKFMAPTEDATRKSITRFYHHFLAYGVFMVDGINVLSDREKSLPEIISFFEEFDQVIVTKVVRYMSELNRRANRAVTLTEAYAMETTSRLRWAQFGGFDLTSSAVTGIQGTSTLGMNWAQLTWIAINRFEDMKDRSEREWENAKFVASAMAGKGMSKVHNQDRRRRQSERKDKIERRDKVLRAALLGESMDKVKTDRPNVYAARTVEELAQQLKSDLSGEKDWHDQVIDAYDNKRREDQQIRNNQLLELQKQNDEIYGDINVAGASLIGLTHEQVRARMLRQQQLKFQALNREAEHDPKLQKIMEKLDSVGSSSPEEVPFIPTSTRTPGVPFKTGK